MGQRVEGKERRAQGHRRALRPAARLGYRLAPEVPSEGSYARASRNAISGVSV